MIRSFISKMRNAQDKPKTSRTFVRHESAECLADIYGQVFAVLNWSFGGMVIDADDDLFTENQEIPFTLGFNLTKEKLLLRHKGTVTRNENNQAAVKFSDPLPHEFKRGLERVAEDAHNRKMKNTPLA